VTDKDNFYLQDLSVNGNRVQQDDGSKDFVITPNQRMKMIYAFKSDTTVIEYHGANGHGEFETAF